MRYLFSDDTLNLFPSLEIPVRDFVLLCTPNWKCLFLSPWAKVNHDQVWTVEMILWSRGCTVNAHTPLSNDL